ncbi:MAG: 23S rRNA (adenine(2503)-C(2))-methyltransferase RlmN [Erysipelotrichales bacterium]|nr:23S rRNA (adenine(2503)-C(2))-methyltransferase RlmN [Erysipelotrichales bacterium]MBQ1387158.1 23S rRNA (adenine(2503)-C(2))-methyltransferase RlmN [Erysipelotrichales bacterium]MBQ2309578.1 23S rRNA (adenine(2503)-C(2))-methyltransferase RlmN [Erysipelotrichales bacterium]MBQ2478311.1 23S rRNA (adenine(2503)-C(2))-methyltransferase RlmN [Erysipelotrichales bacterium]MBQ4012192.1 23S rRNA (adenine(2503)-C(2))-methyltransferase RlmN [Erysipelotrichales bacterium]
MRSIYDLTYDEMTEMVLEHGWKKYRGDQIFRWLYRKKAESFDAMTDLKAEMIETLKNEFSLQLPKLVTRQVSRDGTRKYLFELEDGSYIESVMMVYEYGKSVCVTSQVGCNMGCTFCASGLLKKQRSLSAGEMTGQILAVQKDLDETGDRVSHIVVMGTGEPFDNYDNVMTFCKTVNHDVGLGIGARHITVSTCGIVPGIYRFADEHVQFNLAISLHAPNNELRSKLMPVNKAYPIEELMKALHYYAKENKRRLSYEYILLKGVNDSEECARQLAQLTRGLDVYVNLIPYNEVDEHGFRTLDYKQAMVFYDKLKKLKVGCTLRQEHGADIDAACGQLRAKYEGSKSS